MALGDLDGKVALITGGAGGIGQALTRAFVAHGMRVGICDVRPDGAEALARELGSERALAITADVADPAACAQAVDAVAARFGALHVLVNNAGLGMSLVRRDHMDGKTRIEDVSIEQWQLFFATNASGAFFMAKAAVPRFRRQRWGRIINVTTSFFSMLRGGFAPYGPAKAALEANSAIWAQDLAGTGVTVNVLVPGGMADTALLPVDAQPNRAALISPRVMVAPIVWLTSRASDGTTAQRIVAKDWQPGASIESNLRAAAAPVWRHA